MTTLYIVLLLVANGFFVAAEFALVKVPAVRIAAMVNEGKPLAGLAQKIHQNLEAYLAACQLGITMASLGLGWLGEPAVAALLTPTLMSWGIDEHTVHTVSFLVGFIVFSSLHIVVGEQVPKTYAIRRADIVVLWIALPLEAFYLLAWPLNALLNLASASCLRLLGVEEVSHAEVLSGGEIRGLIDVSRDAGEIEAGKAVMLEQVFKFDQRPASRIMLPRSEIAALDSNSPMEEVLAHIRESRHSRFPVVDNNNWREVKGVVMSKDLLLAYVAKPAQTLADYASLFRPAQLVPETQPINILFEEMRSSREHMALAVDEYGQIAGLVTLEDLVEEIVGEIADETDIVMHRFAASETDTGWLVHGLVSLSDLERSTGIDVAEAAGTNTLAGFIMTELHRIPTVGDEITAAGHTFTIREMNRSRVELVEIARLPEPAAPPAADDEPPPAPH